MMENDFPSDRLICKDKEHMIGSIADLLSLMRERIEVRAPIESYDFLLEIN